jgi:hypothetical protein
MKKLRRWALLTISGLATALLTCQSSQGPVDCPEGVVAENVCWPRDCPERICPERFFCYEGECTELACLGHACPPGEACARGGCYPLDCAWRNCPGQGEVCVDEQCLPASCLEVDCPEGSLCAAGRCYPRDCDTRNCPGYGEVCVGDTCLDRSCVDVLCPTGLACALGRCYPIDCQSQGCPGAREACVEGECRQIACVEVTCAGGRVCANGWCYDPHCPDESCAALHEACVEGRCLPTACAGVTCPPGQRCARGVCFPERCDPQVCAADEVCLGDACLNWNCVWVTCPAGSFCLDGDCAPIRCQTDLECDDRNACTRDTCRPDQGCVYQPVDGPCNDGDGCSMDDRCQAGVCRGDPLDTDGDGYVAAACGGDDCDDARAGVHPGAQEGPPGDATCADGLDNDCDGLTDLQAPACGECARDEDCDDADACNGQERCQDHRCLSGDPPDCDDRNACTQDRCEPLQGCVHEAFADGVECAPRSCQGLVWTRRVCQAGQCGRDEAIRDCNDGQACTADSCSAAGGCTNAPVTNGTECGSRYCNGLEWRRQTCQSGACTGSALQQNCNDANVCTNDACAAATGCSHTHNTAACASDSNSCTNDVCSGGVCRHNYIGDHQQCIGASVSAQRCCGGSCRDIRSNTSHCGGCGAACASGQACEDVSSTTSCSSHPAGVSGRCRCSSNSQCPQGQICRLQTPYANRCAPENSADCPNRTFVDVSSCPNYCRY